MVVVAAVWSMLGLGVVTFIRDGAMKVGKVMIENIINIMATTGTMKYGLG